MSEPSPGVWMQLCQSLPLTGVIALILLLTIGLIEKLDMGQKMHAGSHIPPLDGRITKYCLYIMITSLTLISAAYPLCPQDCYMTLRESRAFSTLTSLHKNCYKGKTPPLCQSLGVPRTKYWTAEITQNVRSQVITRASREGSKLATLTFLNGGSWMGEGCKIGPFKKL